MNPVKKEILISQKNEITEYFIYKKLSKFQKNEENRKILLDISKDELKHYNYLKKYTGQEIKPNKFRLWKYFIISKIFGLTFGLKLMENGETLAQGNYKNLSKEFKEAKYIEKDEVMHEKKLINLLDEEKLKYASSIVLGLNDALVELTGALAGFTLALNNSSIIAIAGLVTGIAASLSMAASEYLSKKQEETRNKSKTPLKASIYTGAAYLTTVILLILPYLLLNNIYISLIWMLIQAIVIIFLFNYYISIAKDYSFKKRFLEMLVISLGVTIASFIIGLIIQLIFKIEV